MAAITAKETRRGERRGHGINHKSECRQYTSIEQALGDALAAYGVTGLAIRADSGIHRFDSTDKPKGNRNAGTCALRWKWPFMVFGTSTFKKLSPLAARPTPPPLPKHD